MKYRKLGPQPRGLGDLLGSWLTTGSGRGGEARDASTGVRSRLNFIDTAKIYGRGAAESFLGEACPDGRAIP